MRTADAVRCLPALRARRTRDCHCCAADAKSESMTTPKDSLWLRRVLRVIGAALSRARLPSTPPRSCSAALASPCGTHTFTCMLPMVVVCLSHRRVLISAGARALGLRRGGIYSCVGGAPQRSSMLMTLRCSGAIGSLHTRIEIAPRAVAVRL